jgi:hypothetical protein
VSKHPNHRDAVAEYVRRLGNPYAKQQLIGVEEEKEKAMVAAQSADPDLRQPTEDERAYAKRQGNQYTLLSVAIAEPQKEVAAAGQLIKKPKRTPTGTASLSKNDFIAGCRRIFRHYIPAVENGRIRRHHRDFITHNQNRSSTARYSLLKELSKYDLSALPGVQARFNREREDLTDQKLKQIERSVLGKDSD